MIVSKRLVSLDVLRGMTISFMILVNNPGSWKYVYPPLRHAEWNGCTPTDLVFPFFLFIVGMSIFFSFKKYQVKISKTSLLKIFKRTIIIFFLGFLLNLFPHFNFENVRVMGVLQRIAIAYGLGSVLCLSLKQNQLLFVLIGLLLGYWALLYFTSGAELYSLENNIVRKLDLFLLGEKHVYKGFGIPFDPEGLLSTISSVGTVIIGFLTGKLVGTKTSVVDKMKVLLLYGVAMVVLGALWGIVFPINKALWTSSYVLYAGGWAMLFLTILIYTIDYKGYSKWARPFIHFGTNPLFIFVFSGVYVKTISYLIKIPVHESANKISGYKYLFEHIFSSFAGNMNGSLLFALSHIFFFWLICFFLFKNKIFIKI